MAKSGNRLHEREKELSCMHAICLLAASAPGPEAIAQGVCDALCSAMQFDEMASCEMVLYRSADTNRIEVRTGKALSEKAATKELLEATCLPENSGGWWAAVRLFYTGADARFLPQEKTLLNSVMIITADMLRTAALLKEVQDAAQSLEAKNIALREVVAMVEGERAKFRDSLKETIHSEWLPLLEKVQESGLSPERREAYLALLKAELERAGSEGSHPELIAASLSPREREVCVQVRNGRTSKEIAGLLGISAATVERHRHNIRHKLKIHKTPYRLGSFLDS